jgi:outer membrane immunogenic protein
MKKLTISLLAGVAAVGFASSALAADLIIDDDFVEPGVVVIDDWSGVYIGGHVGWGWGHVLYTDDPDDDLPSDIEDWTVEGWLVGAQIGANVQMDALVFGVVGDLAWTNITGDSVEVGVDTLTTDIHWLGTVRGKLGFAADMFMVYGTAGVAFAGVEHTLTEDWMDPNPTFTDSATQFGWVAGVGAEVKVAENVSIFGELLYHDFGDADFDWDEEDEAATLGLNVTTAKIGVNFHF